MNTFDFWLNCPFCHSTFVRACKQLYLIKKRFQPQALLFFYVLCSSQLLLVSASSDRISTGVFVRHFHANIKYGGRKSISVYVCLTLWQVVDLWTAGSVSGIIYGLYGQSRGWGSGWVWGVT